MRKIKICVATLLLGGFSYGQSTDYKQLKFDKQTQLFEESVKEFQKLNFLIEEIIENLRKDMHYGKINTSKGHYYLNEITLVKQRNRELMNKLWNQRNKTLGEYHVDIEYDRE